MIKKILLSTIVGLISQASIAQDQFLPLTQFIKQSKEITGLPSGTAVAIVKGDKIIYQQNFGFSDIKNNKPVTKDTLFYAASTSKAFYALSTLIDINNNEYKASDTLNTLFPEDVYKNLPEEYTNKITIKDLLVHSSGIENDSLSWAVAYTGLHNKKSRKSILLDYTQPIKNNSHGEFKYSNFGYNLLSIWLEEKDNISWQEKIQQDIYTPLKMTHTTSIMSEARNKKWDVAKPYSFINKDKAEPLYLQKADNTMHSAGGMVTTASDMAQMLIAQLNNGVVNSKQVFPAEVIKQSQHKEITHEGSFGGFSRDGYAWGWHTGDLKGERALHHHGGFAGMHPSMSFIPKQKIGVVVLNNEDFMSPHVTAAINDIAYSILLKQSDGKAEVKKGLEKISAVSQGFPKRYAKHIAKLDGRPWKLTLPRQEYTGTYQHPTLGDITIKLDDQKEFSLSWGRLKTSARAFTSPDSIRVEFIMFSGDKVQFNMNEKGVESLTLDGNNFAKT